MHRLPIAARSLPRPLSRRCLDKRTPSAPLAVHPAQRQLRWPIASRIPSRYQSTAPSDTEPSSHHDVTKYDHLDPLPPDYSVQPFTDSCELTVGAGSGGHGCISFLREIFIANGPPNGGDGGTGGSVYIQAVRGETSLHKLARRGILKAGRGRNGQGSMKGGARGEDMVITVPVGTIVREVSRHDPLDVEEQQDRRASRGYGRDAIEDSERDEADDKPDLTRRWRRDKWLLYPGALPKSFSSADFPALPRPRRSNLTSLQPVAPIYLDLSEPMEQPLLLAAGAMGGMGNPHFVTKSITRPKYATKGDDGISITLQLELKLLADVGLVGLPNAGKSTLLRAISRSRTRIGDWAFTTLTPNIGTVVLDSHVGRPLIDVGGARRGTRPNFTVADIPGLIEDAHLDRGLGLGFLRHIERAAVLAFVIDLSAGDAVLALQSLWREIGEYEKLRHGPPPPAEEEEKSAPAMTAYAPFPLASSEAASEGPKIAPIPVLPPISSKPWLVVATKADRPETRENFLALQTYLGRVQAGDEVHPSGRRDAWRRVIHAVPVAAINKEGVDRLPGILLGLLDG